MKGGQPFPHPSGKPGSWQVLCPHCQAVIQSFVRLKFGSELQKWGPSLSDTMCQFLALSSLRTSILPLMHMCAAWLNQHVMHLSFGLLLLLHAQKYNAATRRGFAGCSHVPYPPETATIRLMPACYTHAPPTHTHTHTHTLTHTCTHTHTRAHIHSYLH